MNLRLTSVDIFLFPELTVQTIHYKGRKHDATKTVSGKDVGKSVEKGGPKWVAPSADGNW